MLARPVLTVVPVIVGSLLLGGCFGTVAGDLYAFQWYRLWMLTEGPYQFTVPPLGAWGSLLGIASGLLVSLLWCRTIVARSRCPKQSSLIRIGALLGMLAGVISAVVLHAGLIIVLAYDPMRPKKELFDPGILVIGLACGIISGLLLGAYGGRRFTLAGQMNATASAEPVELTL